ncbi:MAG: hypothetical protein J3T61_00100 [Candidatus Brocadiales bacterium]|nr:hypothetical protein [Candidatus Bathyanammoxibius sp.]
MNDAEKYAEILQDAKKLKSGAASDMMRTRRGPMRWLLSRSHKIFAWVERQARAALDH